MKFTFAPESTPLPGYTIKRAIARGGFGEVYYALSDAGKEVALKLLQQNSDIELRGVRQCLNLKHPNLVTIFDIKTDEDGDQWIVMEYVSGRGLHEVLAEDRRDGMPVDEIAEWLDGIAAGVAYLHDHGIVHRDLKPANIYREAGVVKVGDVGLSKIISPSQRSAQTESIGTVYYMAPEVAHGRYGPEVDVYSTGVILYELLTGRVPFEGETTAEILMKHLSQQPDLAPLPAALRPVLKRALEKDPSVRTASLGDLVAEFHAAIDEGPAAAGPTEIPTRSFARPVTVSPPVSTRESPTVTLPPQPAVAPPARRQRRQRRQRRPQPSRPLHHPRPLDPLGPRTLGWHHRVLEATGSMTLAVPWTATFTAMLWILGFFGNDPAPVAGFGLTTLLAAWAVLAACKSWEGTGRDTLVSRRLTLFVLGGLVGLTASWFHQVLLVEMPFESYIQDHGLVNLDSTDTLQPGNGRQPSRAGYVLFFASLFGLRRWWWHTDGFRPKRFRTSSLVLTWCLGFLLAIVWGFQPNYAMAWAVAVSCVVQLSANWIPPTLRTLVTQEETDG